MTASKTSSTEAIQQTAFKELVAQYANLSPLNGARQGNVRCPFHDDHTPSLSVNLDECVFKCHGCHVKGGLTQFRRLVKQHRLQNGHRGGEGGEVIPPSTKVKSLKPPGLTLADLAAAKKLPEAFLRSLGVHDAAYYNPPAVSIVYRDVDGNEQAIRYRLAVTGPERFKWRRGARPTFYGLDRHREIKNAGWLLLVEGESDCWSAWHHEIPAVGVPGKESWPACWSRCPSEIRDLLAKVRVFLWQERDATHLPRIVGETLPDLRVIQPPRDIKDVSDLHLRARDKTALVVEHLKRKALTLEAWQQRAETAAEKTRRHEAAAKAKAGPKRRGS